LVGICVERSVEMVVGLVAILKAGGAYVPLDPSYPKDRLAFLLSDSSAPVLLTQQHLLPRLPDYSGRVVCVDTVLSNDSLQDVHNPDTGVGPGHLCYTIYTSGSTGAPKGVMLDHRG